MLKGLGVVAFCLVGAIVYTKKPWLSVESKKAFGPAVDALVIELNKDVDEFWEKNKNNLSSSGDNQKTLQNKYKAKATNFDPNLIPQVKELQREIGKGLEKIGERKMFKEVEWNEARVENIFQNNPSKLKEIQSDIDNLIEVNNRYQKNRQNTLKQVQVLNKEKKKLQELKNRFSNDTQLNQLKTQPINVVKFNGLRKELDSLKELIEKEQFKLALLKQLYQHSDDGGTGSTPNKIDKERLRQDKLKLQEIEEGSDDE